MLVVSSIYLSSTAFLPLSKCRFRARLAEAFAASLACTRLCETASRLLTPSLTASWARPRGEQEVPSRARGGVVVAP